MATSGFTIGPTKTPAPTPAPANFLPGPNGERPPAPTSAPAPGGDPQIHPALNPQPDGYTSVPPPGGIVEGATQPPSGFTVGGGNAEGGIVDYAGNKATADAQRTATPDQPAGLTGDPRSGAKVMAQTVADATRAKWDRANAIRATIPQTSEADYSAGINASNEAYNGGFVIAGQPPTPGTTTPDGFVVGPGTGATPAPTPAPGTTPPGTTPAPTPAPTTPEQQAQLNTDLMGIQWTGREKEATDELWAMMQKNGWTVDQVASVYNWFSPDQIREHLAKYGYGVDPANGGIVNGAAQLGDPTSWDVTNDQTVEGRINRIIQSDNPLNQQAQTRALQEMNARGTTNSGIAISAGQSALYDAAMPIATADAATYAKAAGYNADQKNQFDVRNIDAQNQFGLADKQIDAQKDITGMQLDSQERTARLNAQTQTTIAQLNADSQAQAAKLQADNQTLLQTNAQAAQAFNTAMSAINNIQNNDKMDADSKTRAMANVWHDVQNQLRLLSSVSGLNLGQDLTFAGQPGFDAEGNWVGFKDGTAETNAPVDPNAPPPPPTPAPTPAPGGGGSIIDYSGSGA